VVIRVGLVLPTFRDSPDEALELAADAIAAGVDGVFCYDHLWPMGQPERPALAPFPVLAAIAATSGASAREGGGPFLGTLVARVGLVPNDVLLAQFVALEALAPGRVIAGLGTGDRLSREENEAYGIPFESASERRADMVRLARTLLDRGIAVWLAGGSAGRAVESAESGAALNMWDADPVSVAERASGPEGMEVTWAGTAPDSEADLRARVHAVSSAGATWAVFGWPVDPGQLVEAARLADSSRG
jgi:alkanesulfonate monooxygenase SsuD/methylene tetrahydromethanopterin reductase-like flavin-dependent oxidoreductase (luciferase family)